MDLWDSKCLSNAHFRISPEVEGHPGTFHIAYYEFGHTIWFSPTIKVYLDAVSGFWLNSLTEIRSLSGTLNIPSRTGKVIYWLS